MKKEKISFRFYRYCGLELKASKEIPYECRLSSRLTLDELCFNWNKDQVEEAVNLALDTGNYEAFMKWSTLYKQFIWE